MNAHPAPAYYPPPESVGGWRKLTDPAQIRALAGVDSDALAPARQWNARHGVASAVVIIRRGYLVAEWYENGATPQTRFNIHSCTKSFTGMAYGILFEDARRGVQHQHVLRDPFIGPGRRAHRRQPHRSG